jgi:methyl-accepting chemotaxis protein WspA
MTTLTSWRRLNTAFWLLIVLVLAGVGLALWAAAAGSARVRRGDQLCEPKNSIKYDVVFISDTVRGLLLDPKNLAEKRRKSEAEADLDSQLKTIQSEFTDYSELMRSVSNLSGFTSHTLGDFHRQVLDQAETDSAGAVMLYVKDYPDIRDKRSNLFTDLTKEIERVRNAEVKRGERLALVGLAPLVILLLAIPIVGRVHSSTVAQPLNRLVAALDRMSQGDFTERVALQRRDEFGILGNGLNRLADDLSALVGQVQRSGIQVNTTATEIAATAREQQSTAHEIAATPRESNAASSPRTGTTNPVPCSRPAISTMRWRSEQQR